MRHRGRQHPHYHTHLATRSMYKSMCLPPRSLSTNPTARSIRPAGIKRKPSRDHQAIDARALLHSALDPPRATPPWSGVRSSLPYESYRSISFSVRCRLRGEIPAHAYTRACAHAFGNTSVCVHTYVRAQAAKHGHTHTPGHRAQTLVHAQIR